MLELIGLGLYDENDLTLRGIAEAKTADKVCIELYTSCWHGSTERLEKIIGKKIEILKRKDLEENSEKILEEAKSKKVVLFVQGDPLIATTHSALILEARKKQIETRIVHNASIISAIAETGLHIYKFGPPVTIPFPEKTKGKPPESVYDLIKMNKERGLHTLCLLDVVAEEKRYMLPQEAVKILLELEGNKKQDVFTEDTDVLTVGKLGSPKPVFEIKKARDVRDNYFEELPAILIIPGNMHFTEREFVTIR